MEVTLQACVMVFLCLAVAVCISFCWRRQPHTVGLVSRCSCFFVFWSVCCVCAADWLQVTFQSAGLLWIVSLIWLHSNRMLLWAQHAVQISYSHTHRGLRDHSQVHQVQFHFFTKRLTICKSEKMPLKSQDQRTRWAVWSKHHDRVLRRQARIWFDVFVDELIQLVWALQEVDEDTEIIHHVKLQLLWTDMKPVLYQQAHFV